MRDPRTATSLFATPEDQETRPRWANPKTSARAAGRVRPRLRARGSMTPLYGSETKPAHSPHGRRKPTEPFPEGRHSAGSADPRTHPRTRGPFSARMDPGLTKDCLKNYTSLRISAFRTSWDTGFFDCLGLRGKTNFLRIRKPVFHITGGSIFCSVLWSTKYSRY